MAAANKIHDSESVPTQVRTGHPCCDTMEGVTTLADRHGAVATERVELSIQSETVGLFLRAGPPKGLMTCWRRRYISLCCHSPQEHTKVRLRTQCGTLGGPDLRRRFLRALRRRSADGLWREFQPFRILMWQQRSVHEAFGAGRDAYGGEQFRGFVRLCPWDPGAFDVEAEIRADKRGTEYPSACRCQSRIEILSAVTRFPG